MAIIFCSNVHNVHYPNSSFEFFICLLFRRAINFVYFFGKEFLNVTGLFFMKEFIVLFAIIAAVVSVIQRKETHPILPRKAVIFEMESEHL